MCSACFDKMLAVDRKEQQGYHNEEYQDGYDHFYDEVQVNAINTVPYDWQKFPRSKNLRCPYCRFQLENAADVNTLIL